MNCSKCKNEIKTMLIEISLETVVYAINDCKKEYIPNMSVKSRENLCSDCFNIMSEKLKAIL